MTPRAADGPGTCPSCGGPLPHEAIRFCVTCGAPLAAPAGHTGPAAESAAVAAATAAGEPATPGSTAGADAAFATGSAGGADRRRRWRLGPVLAAAAVLGLSGGATGALFSQEHAPARQTAAELKAAGAAAQAQVAGLAPALRQSIAAHAAALRATRGVARCRMTPTAAISLMYRAIIRRQRALDRLGRLPVSAIPGGGQMAADLRDALRQSIAADQDVIGWMQDVQESRCPVSPQNDLSFQAGLRAAARATTAQRSFLARWNPVARQYGQPILTLGQL